MTQSHETVTIFFNELCQLIKKILIKAGVAEATAEILSQNCASCERDGTKSHGVFRVAGYLSSLKCGWVDGQAQPEVADCGASFIRVDAKNGFAQLCLAKARPLTLQKVRETGCCVLAVRGSHHLSALWPDVEPFADEGYCALSFVAGLPVVVAPGGRQPVFGTNPFAFATPVAGQNPLVFDFATSALSNGDTRMAAREGRELPPGSGIDKKGQPTNDPQAILDGGALLPFGAHKGAAIILMVEILAAALTGGAFSREVNFAPYPGAETPKTGQVFLIIDPSRGGNDVFSSRVRQLIDWLHESGDNVRLPGERRYANREKAKHQGIAIDKVLYDQMISYLGSVE